MRYFSRLLKQNEPRTEDDTGLVSNQLTTSTTRVVTPSASSSSGASGRRQMSPLGSSTGAPSRILKPAQGTGLLSKRP